MSWNLSVTNEEIIVQLSVEDGAAATALAAAAAAEVSRLTAESSAVDSEAAKVLAETAATGAETAQGLAESARAAAVIAKDASELAATTSQTAKGLAEAAAVTAEAQAVIATAQAVIADTKAGEALSSANSASGSASTATTQAGIATTQAGIATTKAAEAAASAATANQVGTSTPLTGYTVGANTPLSEADSILGAFGKVQSQINSSQKNPFSMLGEGNNDFVIMASIIGRAGGTFTHGQPIVWEILKNNSQHDTSFYRSLIPNSGQASLDIVFPPVKNVISSMMTGDETIHQFAVNFGSNTGINKSTFFAGRLVPQGFQLRGNGTNWTASGTFASAYSLNSISGAGLTTLNLPASVTGFDAETIIITYTGRNNYRIERQYSGLGGSAGVGFFMVDNATNTRVTTAPTTDDYIHISNFGIAKFSVNLAAWNISNTSLGNGFLLNNNFWCIGMYELWMKAFPLSSTSIKVIWQSKSGVTQYKLRRSTAFTVDVNGNYVLTTPTQVYAGTALEFIETGLSANTMYYYQLLDQSDVEITQFNTKTRF